MRRCYWKNYLLVLGAVLTVSIGPSLAADISGFVRDESNGESLPFVSVYLKGEQHGGISNESGYYAITRIPPGRYTLAASLIGYKTFKKEVDLGNGDLVLDLPLAEEAIELETVVVEAEREAIESFDISPGRTVLQVKELKAAPAAIEADPIRTIQTLPGVATLSDFSVGLYVRGGTPDQNLVLLDGTDVYNASHLFGLFSTFPADAAKSTELLRGGFPAKYGGRLSSVLNVITDEGNKEKFEAEGGVSLLSSRLTVQGPAGKGSWLVSGRRTHLEPLLSYAEGQSDDLANLTYNFFDLQGKTHQILSHGDQLTVAGYAGRDNLNIRILEFDADLEWGNRTISSKWTHVFDSSLFGNFLATASRFNATTTFDTEDVELEENNRLTDASFKADMNYFPSKDHAVEVGLLVKRMSMEYTFGESDLEWVRVDVEGFHNSIYVQDNWSLNRLWTVQPGLRFNQFTNGDYSGWSPRLAARYQLGAKTYLKGAAGRYHQYIFRLSREFQGISILSNVWALADSTAGPSAANHFIAGLETERYGLNFDVELYYKGYKELYELNYDEQNSTQIGDILRRGDGEAYGFDALIKKRAGKQTGWVSFSVGLSERTIEGLNRNAAGVEKPFKPKFDRRFSLNIVHSWRLGGLWSLNSRFALASGQPYTQVLGRGELEVPSGFRHTFQDKGDLNGVRLPDYQRLDISLQRRFEFRNWRMKLYLQAVNVTNHTNIFNYFWSEGNIEKRKPGKRREISMLPLLPSIGMDFNF